MDASGHRVAAPEEDQASRTSYLPLEAAFRGGETLRLFLPGITPRLHAVIRCLWTACVAVLAVHGAAFGQSPETAPRDARLKLDPLFRIHHPLRVSAAGARGTATMLSVRADSQIAGFAEFSGTRPRLEALGARVGTQQGSLFTVRIAAADLDRLIRDPELRSFQVARPLSLQLETSGPVIGTPEIHAPGPGFPNGIQGQGVLVGVADTGIDLDAADFKDGAGVTRVVGLWDQYNNMVYDEERLRAGVPVNQDRDGHGTHVTGIAAGNGRATGRGLPAFRHVGVAPLADIAVVKLDPIHSDVYMVEAVQYLFDLARSRGQDAVVNLSLGNQCGPRDGTSMLERMLSALTGPGRILVVSAGNDANDPIHTRIESGQGEARFSVLNCAWPGLNNDRVTLEAWGNPGLQASITLVSPSGSTFGPVAPGEESSFVSPEGDVTIFNGSDTWPLGRDLNTPVGNSSSWFVVAIADRTDAAHTPAAGEWTLSLSRQAGEGVFDLWVDGIGFTSCAPCGFATADPSRTLTVPGTCDSCITVGSFVTKVAWQDSSGLAAGYALHGIPVAEVGALSDFSSRGPRRDGLLRPDLAAPGQGVASSMSHDDSQEGWRIAEDASHVVKEGTSMAAPHVAGAVALLLQMRPHLLPARVRDILRRAAREDTFTGAVPNPQWGAGKLDLRRLIEVVNETLPGATREMSLSHVGSPSHAPVRFRILAGATHGPARLQVFSVDGRRIFQRDLGSIPAGLTEVEWDPTVNGSRAASGVYFARLRAGATLASDKVVLLR